MTPKLLRLAYAIEFLVAVMAIFTAWSEIGGQDALDLMHWGWKIGFSLALSLAMVAYTAAIVSQESFWTLRSARWLTAIVVIVAAMAAVTYFYVLQEQTTGDTDEGATISSLSSAPNAALLAEAGVQEIQTLV